MHAAMHTSKRALFLSISFKRIGILVSHSNTMHDFRSSDHMCWQADVTGDLIAQVSEK